MSPFLFPLGHTVFTPGVRALMVEGLINGEASPAALVERHQAGDWGCLSADDLQANQDALREGSRIFSAYLVADTKVWVITEADRASTCVLLPEEY